MEHATRRERDVGQQLDGTTALPRARRERLTVALYDEPAQQIDANRHRPIMRGDAGRINRWIA